MPQFAHLPLLLKPEGNGKLSKRDGDRLGFPVFPLEWHDPKSGDISSGYREKDYLPQAVVNFLALLGWNPGNDQELMTMDEMIKLFDLSRCSKAGARFDYKKLIWFNHEYILQADDAAIADAFLPLLKVHGVEATKEQATIVVSLMKSRVNFVHELWEQASYFFVAPMEYDEKSLRKWWKEGATTYVRELCQFIEDAPTFVGAELEPLVMEWIAQKEWAVGKVMNALRVTLVGAAVGPHIFALTDFIGKEETLRRARRALEVLPDCALEK